MNTLYPHTLRIHAIFLAFFILIIGGCAVTDNIKDGDKAFELKKYMTAATLLKAEFEKQGSDYGRADKAFKIAQCYRFSNQPQQAEKWYREAMVSGYGQEARILYARILKTNEKYEAAIEQFQQYLKEEPFKKPEINKEIEACRNAMEWTRSLSHMDIVNVSDVNTASADFSPVLYGGNKLVFTSSRTGATGEVKDQWTSDNFYDIFEVDLQGFDSYSAVRPLSGFANTPYNEGAVTFSADLQEMYFTRCGSDDKNINDFCFLYYAYLEPEGSWSNPELITLFSDSINYGHPFLTSDGKQLYFSAADPEGYGGSDIYYVKSTPDGWGNPINLGPGINTEGNEAFPWINENGTLYFASDGHPGMGGLDIFSSRKVKNKWSELTNLRSPINSGADDFGIFFHERSSVLNEDTLAFGFFCSTREGGKGNDDLYRFIEKKPPPPPPVYVLKGVVKEKMFSDPSDPESLVVGYKELGGASISIRNEDLEKLVSKFSVDSTAAFELSIDSLTDYKITASKEPDYFTNSENATTKNIKGGSGETVVVEVEVILDKIYEEKEIRLNNIYYDFNSADLREESFPELNLLLELLNENPSIIIELGSHTDSRGTDEYNQDLSQRRAESVVTYLQGKGVDQQRMVAIGYGESKLTNQCEDGVECTEEEHQKNRRTTFSVRSDRLKIESVVPEDIIVDPKPGEYINDRENEDEQE